MANSLEKTCNKCGVKLEVGLNWTGYCANNYANMCINCLRNDRRFRESKRSVKHKKIMRELKVNGCAICGYDRYIGSLDFHHVNPDDKKFYLGIRSLALKDENIVDEVNKCILLCANCHRKLHQFDLRKGEPINKIKNGKIHKV